ncbi:MAG: hypothetical protein HC789_14790 [Microcoleus sp. CSU_2_2]|nr:hypothetical protein [Microcoleus sp. SU_5_3]NJS11540.1 hypothetical protein [Microcoleus sp. CSU_2_2]
MSDEPEKTQILTQQPETISTASDEFDRTAIVSPDFTSEPAETPTEITPIEDFLIKTPETPQSVETPIASSSPEDISTAIPEPETIPITTDSVPETSQTESDSPLIIQTGSPEPKKTRIWQILAVFLSGMLVGSVLSLGTLLAWRMYQERANIQIRLPADVPLPESPSPIATAPLNRLPAIPPAPGTVSSQPPANAPSSNPTAIPSLSGVPQLPSPSPSLLPSAASPAPESAETAITDRVSFEAGATGTTLSNSLPANKSKRYLIDCNSGQSMTVKVQESGVSAAIIAPNGEKIGTANSTSQWQGQLPSSGDYTIELSGDDRLSYTVKIDVL